MHTPTCEIAGGGHGGGPIAHLKTKTTRKHIGSFDTDMECTSMYVVIHGVPFFPKWCPIPQPAAV